MLERSRLIGSEDYNAPELNYEEMESMNSSQMQPQASEKLINNKEIANAYDGIKADIFSSATTLFLMVMRSPPFRKATLKDPFFKRLNNNDKKHFWNIFKGIPCSMDFKDLFEKISRKIPEERLTIEEMLNHPWL